MEAARRVGLNDKLFNVGWSNMTSGEIGYIVREMIKMGEEVLVDNHQNGIPPLF